MNNQGIMQIWCIVMLPYRMLFKAWLLELAQPFGVASANIGRFDTVALCGGDHKG